MKNLFILGGHPKDYNEEFVYLLGGCNYGDMKQGKLGCGYCFLSEESKDGKHGRYFTTKEIVDRFENEDLNVIRYSGGEPTLAIEHWQDVLQEIENRGLKAFVQVDSNITTMPFLKDFLGEKKLDDTLERIGSYKNTGVLACFKGITPENFNVNTGVDPKFFDSQFDMAEKLVDSGIKTYFHMINVYPEEKVPQFLEKIERIFGRNGVLNTHLLGIMAYWPEEVTTPERLKKKREALERRGFKIYANDLHIEDAIDSFLVDNYGKHYKETYRPGLKI